jgi:hypothetical protein
MSKWLANTLGVTLIAFLCFAAWGGYLLERHILPVVDSYKAGDTLSKLDQVFDTINRPCGGGHPCGTLANADKAMVKVGDILVTSQLQERDVAKAAESNMAAVNGLATHLNKTADALTATSNAATGSIYAFKGSADALTGTFNAATGTLHATQAPIDALTQDASDLDALLKSPSIYGTLDNVNLLTGNINGIAENGRRVTDKLTNDFVAPKPWYRKIVPSIGDIWDLSALAARHTP